MKTIHQVNVYFHENEPWNLAQSNLKLFEQVLSATCHSLCTIGLLLWPVMPKKMEALLVSLGISGDVHKIMLQNLKMVGIHTLSYLKQLLYFINQKRNTVWNNQ